MITYKDFYPTDKENAEKLSSGLDLPNRRVLEPQAGKGDLARYLSSMGALVEVCEIDNDLAMIVSKEFNFIKHDFLSVTSSEVSHFDYIIMNPPFSEAEKHILHAWKIAPDGCIIRSFMNRNTYIKQISRARGELKLIIDEHGKNFGSGKLFSDSERPTNVDVLLIELIKPSEYKSEWEGYFEEEDSDLGEGEGMMQYDEVRNIVQRVVGSVKVYDEALHKASVIHDLVGVFPSNGSILDYEFQISSNSIPRAREDFKKEVQKRAWRYVFKQMNLGKYLTTKVQEDIDKFVEKQQKVPFTMKNVYEVLNIVVGTAGEMMKRTYLDVFNRLTSHYKDNRHSIEGWATNSHYMINKKIIVPHVVDPGWGNREEYCIEWNDRHAQMLEDLHKLLCHMTGVPFDEDDTLYRFFNKKAKTREEIVKSEKFIEECQSKFSEYRDRGEVSIRFDRFFELQADKEYTKSSNRDYLERNTWYDWGFFSIKFYKKGTIHLKWKDDQVWRMFNKRICEILGYNLPEKF